MTPHRNSVSCAARGWSVGAERRSSTRAQRAAAGLDRTRPPARPSDADAADGRCRDAPRRAAPGASPRVDGPEHRRQGRRHRPRRPAVVRRREAVVEVAEARRCAAAPARRAACSPMAPPSSARRTSGRPASASAARRRPHRPSVKTLDSTDQVRVGVSRQTIPFATGPGRRQPVVGLRSAHASGCGRLPVRPRSRPTRPPIPSGCRDRRQLRPAQGRDRLQQDPERAGVAARSRPHGRRSVPSTPDNGRGRI